MFSTFNMREVGRRKPEKDRLMFGSSNPINAHSPMNFIWKKQLILINRLNIMFVWLTVRRTSIFNIWCYFNILFIESWVFFTNGWVITNNLFGNYTLPIFIIKWRRLCQFRKWIVNCLFILFISLYSNNPIILFFIIWAISLSSIPPSND